MEKKIGAIMTALALGLPAHASSLWQEKLHKDLSRITERAGEKGELGLYVRDLSTGEEFSYGAERVWYLASGVKVPVAVELLKRAEAGEKDIDGEIPLGPGDYIDGPGETNGLSPGSRVSRRFLLEQMLIHSDNTASDLLIRDLGLEKVNALVSALVPEGFREITTLADVRRHAYSGIHPSAFGLSNADLLKVGRSSRRKGTLAEVLGLGKRALKGKTLDDAFDTYYKSGLNSATLRAYGELLAKIARGEALGAESTSYLLGLMEKAETGKRRIRAGLPGEIAWAHKTGTQFRRLCDFGLAWKEADRKFVLAACAAGFSVREGEKVLRQAGASVAKSGLFSPP